MHSLLLGLFLFGSPSPALAPGTPIRLTGAPVLEGPGPYSDGVIRGRLIRSTQNTYTVDAGAEGALTFARPGQAIQGRLVSANEAVLTVLLPGSKQPARIPVRAVRDVRVSRRRVPAWGQGAGIGAGIFAGSFLFGAVQTCGGFIRCDNLPLQTVGSAVVGAGVGALVGGAIGRARWDAVEPGRLAVGLSPRRGGIGVSLSVGLPRRAGR